MKVVNWVVIGVFIALTIWLAFWPSGVESYEAPVSPKIDLGGALPAEIGMSHGDAVWLKMTHYRSLQTVRVG